MNCSIATYSYASNAGNSSCSVLRLLHDLNRQAEDDLRGDVLLGPLGHTSGLLCRDMPNTYAPATAGQKGVGFNERVSDFALTER
jgi:hypothetical protein